MDTGDTGVAPAADGPQGDGPVGPGAAADAAGGRAVIGGGKVLRVNEIFGPTVQGEGPAAGRHCLFVRLAGCNLTCRWCDTPYTWAFDERLAAHLERPFVYDRQGNDRAMSVDGILAALRKVWDIDARPTIVVISGGEPLIQQKALFWLASNLVMLGCEVHVETAGTITPSELVGVVHQYVVSPKLAHSGNPEPKRLKVGPLSAFAAMGHRAVFKFVVADVDDLPEVDRIVGGLGIPACRVMVMPEGIDPGNILATGRKIVDQVLARGWSLSLRQHVLLWPETERGK